MTYRIYNRCIYTCDLRARDEAEEELIPGGNLLRGLHQGLVNEYK